MWCKYIIRWRQQSLYLCVCVNVCVKFCIELMVTQMHTQRMGGTHSLEAMALTLCQKRTKNCSLKLPIYAYISMPIYGSKFVNLGGQKIGEFFDISKISTFQPSKWHTQSVNTSTWYYRIHSWRLTQFDVDANTDVMCKQSLTTLQFSRWFNCRLGSPFLG